MAVGPFENIKTENFLIKPPISYTLRGQIWPGASDRMQSDNIWLDRISVRICIYFPYVTSDRMRSWDRDRASVQRPLYIFSAGWL